MTDIPLPPDTPPHHSYFFPPSTWRDAGEYEFCTFISHLHEDNCLNCSAIVRHSDIYRVFRRKKESLDNLRRLVPMTYPLPDQAPVVIMRLPTRFVPICPFCLDASREGSLHLIVSTEEAWNEALRRSREVRTESERAAKRSSTGPRPTIDPSEIPF